MRFTKENLPCFVHDESCPSGIVKIADKVRKDMELVFGSYPEASDSADAVSGGMAVVYGIAGRSPVLDGLLTKYNADLSEVTGKREVYGFFPVSEGLLLIAGSDKRGTIYGLFHLSELLGVSPFVNWSDLKPGKLDSFIIEEKDTFVSHEPSVEFRGFFINDEWPAFGNWSRQHFGGFTSEMYEGVFELLLRLKGNYLWPAMWSSCFSNDGPGLKNAELADELGVVMGLSHHEPCLRHGEEYSQLRGPESIYGDAWSFLSNREGITRFWRDGLKRSGKFENVITVGMRGERDSTILGDNATLKDNIDLLRDVLRTQRQLISEEVGEAASVPLMLALYKEVEAYYYGDENTPGLKEGCAELEDVILMLCDDNHGYLRSLPDEEMRKHPGGFGMYYHFDYHGSPVSYEWINSTYLPVVKQQMTTAYEYGIRRLWIVNVGDLGLQELPLSYFLDLAYDYDKWKDEDTAVYLKKWLKRQFGAAFDNKTIRRLASLCMEAQRIIHNRRPEHMGENVYHLQADFESYRLLRECEKLEKEYKDIKKKCPARYSAALYELLGYNLLAGINLIQMWIYTAYNHYLAGLGSVACDRYSDKVGKALDRDDKLRERFNTKAGGKWEGLADAYHIGFKNWNSEESSNPVQCTVRPVRGKALVAGCCGEKAATRGQDWTKKTLRINTYEEESEETAVTYIFAALCGDESVDFSLNADSDWIKADRYYGTLSAKKPLIFIRIEVDKRAAAGAEGKISLKYEGGCAEFAIKAPEMTGAAAGVFEERDGRVIMDAAHYESITPGDGAELKIYEALGRREDAVGLYPVTIYYPDVNGAPYADYAFETGGEGEYTVRFQLLACNPWIEGRRIKLVFSVNGEKEKSVCVLGERFRAGESGDWGAGVLSHVHCVEDRIHLKAGLNRIRVYGTDPENMLERIMVYRDEKAGPVSYLGPDESRRGCE